MQLDQFIQITDNFIMPQTCSKILSFVNTVKFQKAGVGHDCNIDFDIRKTWEYPLHFARENMSAVHWYNFLHFVFSQAHLHYKKFVKVDDNIITSIKDINILKYQDKGFYNYHTDHFEKFPRSLSFILLLNNDYEGGQLCFRNPDKTGEQVVDIKPGRLITWPSNFQYPHTVKPVTKGTRYSIVAWGL